MGQRLEFQIGTCAKCKKADKGAEYLFYYGTKRGKVIGNTKVFICSKCIKKQSVRSGFFFVLIAIALVSLDYLFFRRRIFSHWASWVFFLVPTLIIIIQAVIYLFTHADYPTTGSQLAIDMMRVDIVNRFPDVNMFWNELSGKAAEERMKKGVVGTCIKCHQEGVGKNYTFYYGWELSGEEKEQAERKRKEEQAQLFGRTIANSPTMDFKVDHYRIGGSDSRFLCDHCSNNQNGGELTTILAARAEFREKFGENTVFWTDTEMKEHIRQTVIAEKLRAAIKEPQPDPNTPDRPSTDK